MTLENKVPIKENNFFSFESKRFELTLLTPIKLKEFEVDKRYMRKLNQPHASDICKNFSKYYKNFNFCQYTYPIAVSVRDDNSKIIIDGQHRAYAAIKTKKSLFAIFYYGLSLEEEMILYMINNNIKMQSAGHRMDLLARLDSNVKRVYNILDDQLIGWDTNESCISKLNFVGAISLLSSSTPKRDIKKLPFFLDNLTDNSYNYFSQVVSILNEACQFDCNVNKNFWSKADLYLAVFRFVVLFHMRFGNTFKNNEKISEFLVSIKNWDNVYQKSKMLVEGGSRFYSILNEIISIYNRGRRNSDNMIPPCNNKMFDIRQFSYYNTYMEQQPVSAIIVQEKNIKKKKKEIKFKLKKKEFVK